MYTNDFISSFNQKEYNFSECKSISLWGKTIYLRSNSENTLYQNNRYLIAVRSIEINAEELFEKIHHHGIELTIKNSRLSSTSFLVIDELRQVIIAYRDPLGRYPIYWRQQNNEIQFTTTLSIWKDETKTLNPNYFYRYFVGGGFVDLWEDTPYKGIFRIPRGNAIEFSNTDKKKVLYVDKLFVGKTEYRNDDEIDGTYLDLLKSTVKKYRGESSLFQLSGGLDSSALVIANYLNETSDKDNIATFIWDKYKEVDERLGAQLIAKRVEKNPILIPGDQLLPFSFHNFLKPNLLPDEPTPDLCLISWRVPMFELAHQHKHSTIISGFGGDDLLFGNQCVLADLMKKLKFRSSLKQAMEFAQRNTELGLTASWFIKSYAIFPLLKIKQRPPIFSLWDPAIHNRFFIPSFLNDIPLSKKFIKEMEATVNAFKNKSKYITQMGRNLSTVFSTYQMVDAIGRNYNIEERYPYLNRSIVEFILSIPSRFIIDGKDRKVLTKRVFNGYYPPSFNPSQGNFYKLMFISLNQNWTEIKKVIHNSPLCDSGIISRDSTIDFLENWRLGNETISTSMLYSLISACIWVERSGASF